uniref:Ribosomal protein S6 kinase like 1 n=1 Tax=Hippocampus comes TaxID=109280 RepID=A0A3Q2Y1J9_HIPCM
MWLFQHFGLPPPVLSPWRVRMAKRDYLVEAAKQIRMALDSEVNEDYEAAFMDPNKERREAVKRKTTQYLKRAEEIFITHLQDNLGKGNSHLGGYSSLRFRPVRHLSSPMEDLEMCKVVGISDKSLMKCSWESREQPTIIPQGVPYMVKLLRYYVSEDTVYLHLEHVKGKEKKYQLRLKKFVLVYNLGTRPSGVWTAAGLTPTLKRRAACRTPVRPHRSTANGVEEACELLSPGNVAQPSRCYSPSPHVVGAPKRTEGSPVRTEWQGDDQIIEVDGWCHVPRLPLKPSDKSSCRTCWGLPESEVRVWGAQILLALESLHQQGIICRDLNPRNVLLTSNGECHACLTFFGQWSEVQSEINCDAMEQMYCAPGSPQPLFRLWTRPELPTPALFYCINVKVMHMLIYVPSAI